MAKVNIGKMPCETCTNHVTVKQNENDTLSYRCDECDAAPYAKLGTIQHSLWRKKLTPLAKNEPQKEALKDLKKDVEIESKPIVPPPFVKKDMWGNVIS